MKVLWVTALKNLHRENWYFGYRPFEYYTKSVQKLSERLGPDFICFSDEITGSFVYPYNSSDTFIDKYFQKQTEIIESDEFKNLIPDFRRNCIEYVHAEYGLVTFSKHCFVRRASHMFPDYTHYAWIDAGYDDVPFPVTIDKIPNDKIYVSTFRNLAIKDSKPVIWRWGSLTDENLDYYDWNNPRLVVEQPPIIIQGNLWVVPKELTEWFELQMEQSIQRHHEYGVVGHDEPLWLPIIYNNIDKFKLNIKTEWRNWDWIGSNPEHIFIRQCIGGSINHLHNIKQIIESIGEAPEGNSFFDHGTTNYNVKLYSKQYNLFASAIYAKRILEIGFNAGHSCLMFLMANKYSRITIFDINTHSYTKPCFEYLNSVFPGRLEFVSGDSLDTVPKYPHEKFDVVHIDGAHDYLHVIGDIENVKRFCTSDTYIIIDDSNFDVIKKVIESYDFNKMTMFKQTELYEHIIVKKTM